MNYLTATHTDVGIRKKTNQDSILVMEAETEKGNVLFAVVCDGMGGLAKGEVASSTLIKEYERWFEEEFPAIFYEGFEPGNLRKSMENVIYSTNVKISNYGKELGVNLGTTVVALVLFDNKYFCLNVGDSRCYQITDTFKLITKDQTYVQREIDMGRLTEEEALNHPRRSVLLQCVGASEYIMPDFFIGEINQGQVFMLCSDGYRHVITPDEFMQYLRPEMLNDEEQMKKSIVYFTDLNKFRKEEDNISVILIKTV